MATCGSWLTWIPARPARAEFVSILWLLIHGERTPPELGQDDAVRAGEHGSEEGDRDMTGMGRPGRGLPDLRRHHRPDTDRICR